MLLIPNDKAIEIVEDADPSKLRAYAWAVAGQGGNEADQVQYWFFPNRPSIDDLRKNMPPHGAWRWRTTTTAPFASLKDFKTYVVSQYAVPGSSHVWAMGNCKCVTGSASVPAAQFPPYLGPTVTAGSQNDVGTLRCRDGASVIADLWTYWESTHESHEAWALGPNYTLPSGGLVVEVVDYTRFQAYLKDVIWSAQSTMAFTSLRYQTAAPSW